MPLPLPSSNMSSTFFRIRALVQIVYEHLPLLSDLLAFRATCSDSRHVGTSVVSRRFDSIVGPFVLGRVAELRHVMHVLLAVITGSCALDMLTGELTMSNNLNFIVPHGCSEVLYTFLQESLTYRRVNRNRPPHHAYKGVIHGYAMFRRDHCTITVSEATPEGVFKLITASPTTADMIIMTARGLTVFYADWTLAGIALTNHTITDPAIGKHIGCMQRPRFQLRTNTEFLNGPCGARCPVLWRNVAGQGTQSLTLEWDGRFSLLSFIRRSQTIWHLSEHCNNLACMHNPINNSRTARLPPNPMPHDLRSIQMQEARIASHVPTYHGKICALLFATGAMTVHVVDVPLRDGVSQLSQISHLQILHWVDQLGSDKHVLTTGRFRKTYNTNADTPEAVRAYGYTFFREHPSVFSPPNRLIHDLALIKSNENDIMGNVLVVKHMRGRKHDIVDCSIEDIQWVNEIVIRTIDQSEFWT